MNIYRQIAIGASLLCSLLGVAQAHNTWLLPSTTVLSKADWITVDAAVSNDLFFFNHVPLNLDNLTVTAPDGSQVTPENPFKGKLRGGFDLHLTQPGTYRLAVLNTGMFASYTDKATSQARRWRGTPEKFAAEVPADAQDLVVTQSAGRVETFVTVGKPSAWQPSGQGLELVAVTHPNDLVQGERATFAFHIDGQPAANIEVELVRGGTRYRDQVGSIKTSTDAAGRFSVRWPEAGMYWIDTHAKDAKTSLPHARERRLSYVGTVEVLP